MANKNKSVFNMTTRELRAYIRELTPEANERLKGYEEALTKGTTPKSAAFEKIGQKAVEAGTGKRVKGGIGLGLTSKLKPSLIVQARTLEQLIKTDNVSPKAKKEASKRITKQYQTYMERHPQSEMTRKQFKEISEILGAIGDRILEQYGASNTVDKIQVAMEQGKKPVKITEAIQKVYNKSKGNGWSNKELLDNLIEELSIET